MEFRNQLEFTNMVFSKEEYKTIFFDMLSEVLNFDLDLGTTKYYEFQYPYINVFFNACIWISDDETTLLIQCENIHTIFSIYKTILDSYILVKGMER